MNEKEPSDHVGWGAMIGLRIILAIVVLVLAVGGVLWALDFITAEAFQVLAAKTALVGGIVLAANLVLGWLAGGARKRSE